MASKTNFVLRQTVAECFDPNKAPVCLSHSFMMGVSTSPGQRLVTRIPCSRYSAAIAEPKAFIANLEAVYAVPAQRRAEKWRVRRTQVSRGRFF